jgi:hypothetical protein
MFKKCSALPILVSANIAYRLTLLKKRLYLRARNIRYGTILKTTLALLGAFSKIAKSDY